MLSMISYLNLSSGVYIPLYWFFVINIFNIYCFFKPNWWMLKIWSPNHHWTVPSMKWISLYHLYAASMRWISGGFFVKKHLTQGLCLVRFPHPWGKFSTLLQPFYNLPGWGIQGDELATLPLGRGKFAFEGKGWGNSKFCKITDANHGDIRGICRFPQPINTGNIKGAKRSETENTRFRAA